MYYTTELINKIITSPTAKQFLGNVSPVYGESYTNLWLFEVIGHEMDELDEWITDIIKQFSNTTATWALEYYEQEYGIPINKALSDEQRREQINFKINDRAPMNPAKVKHLVQLLVGIPDLNVEIHENVSKNKFIVAIIPRSEDKLSYKAVKELIDRVSPAHLLFEVTASSTEEVSAPVYVDFNTFEIVDKIDLRQAISLALHMQSISEFITPSHTHSYLQTNSGIMLNGVNSFGDKTYLDGTYKLNTATAKYDLETGELINNDVEKLLIQHMPDKTSYFDGEIFDRAGLIIAAQFADNTVSIVPYTIINGGVPLTVGKTSVTVRVIFDESILFYIDVPIEVIAIIPATLEIATPPTTVSYIEGATFVPDGMTFAVIYNNGNRIDIPHTSDKLTFPTAPLTVGQENVEIRYTEDGITISAAQAITVSAKTPTTLEITAQPTVIAYVEGDIFSPIGMTFTATYNNGDTISAIAADDTRLTFPISALTSGQTSIICTFTDNGVAAEAAQTISVSSSVPASISATTLPTQTAYNASRLFNPAGMVITAAYDNGVLREVTDYTYPMVWLTEGQTSVTITYTVNDVAKTVDVAITVGPQQSLFQMYGVKQVMEDTGIQEGGSSISLGGYYVRDNDTSDFDYRSFHQPFYTAKAGNDHAANEAYFVSTGWVTMSTSSGPPSGWYFHSKKQIFSERYVGQGWSDSYNADLTDRPTDTARYYISSWGSHTVLSTTPFEKSGYFPEAKQYQIVKNVDKPDTDAGYTEITAATTAYPANGKQGDKWYIKVKDITDELPKSAAFSMRAADNEKQPIISNFVPYMEVREVKSVKEDNTEVITDLITIIHKGYDSDGNPIIEEISNIKSDEHAGQVPHRTHKPLDENAPTEE